MSERIRSLEDALQTLHAEHAADPDQPHPLMQQNLLTIKSTMGLYTGTQANGPDPSNKTNNGSNGHGTEHMQVDQPRVERGSSEDTVTVSDHQAQAKPVSAVPNRFRTADMKRLGKVVKEEQTEAHFAAEIARLSHNFPLTDSVSPEPNVALRVFIRSNLPPRDEADYLWEQARQNALWQYNPHPSSTFYPNLAYHCYTATSSSLSPRRLALLFMVLAVGCLVDLNREPDHPDAEKYHQLARACLCEVPVMEDTNVETITALFYEIWYLLVFSDKKKAAGYAWGLMGLTAKLAQSVSLQYSA